MTIKTEGVQGLPVPGLDAAREGRTFQCYINGDASLNAAATVITDAGAWQTITPGYRYIVDCFYFTLTTASDTMTFEIVTTAGPGATGAVTAQTMTFFGATAATIDGMNQGPTHLTTPLCFTEADGQTIAMRVLTNDAGATVNCGFAGWWELDD